MVGLVQNIIRGIEEDLRENSFDRNRQKKRMDDIGRVSLVRILYNDQINQENADASRMLSDCFPPDVSASISKPKGVTFLLS